MIRYDVHEVKNHIFGYLGVNATGEIVVLLSTTRMQESQAIVSSLVTVTPQERIQSRPVNVRW